LSLISVEHKASWNHYILPPNFIKFRPLAFWMVPVSGYCEVNVPFASICDFKHQNIVMMIWCFHPRPKYSKIMGTSLLVAGSWHVLRPLRWGRFEKNTASILQWSTQSESNHVACILGRFFPDGKHIQPTICHYFSVLKSN
jgi:hypothetical protein